MGKSSHGSSTSTPTIPPWLQGIIQPLLSGSAAKLQAFQNQGWDVLQGNKPETGVSLEELAALNAQNQATPQQQAAAAAAPAAANGRSPYQR